jgi:endoglucanase
MLNIVDPGDNYAFEAHQYLDWNSSGRSTNIVNRDIGVKRLSGFTEWLKKHKRKGFLGEFAAANSMIGDNTWQIGDEAVTKMLKHMEDNSDVWLGWTWWAAGPIWGDYMFTIEPANDGSERPALKLLKQFLTVPKQ